MTLFISLLAVLPDPEFLALWDCGIVAAAIIQSLEDSGSHILAPGGRLSIDMLNDFSYWERFKKVIFERTRRTHSHPSAKDTKSFRTKMRRNDDNLEGGGGSKAN